MNSLIFSLVTPSYNSDKFIAKTIESILLQEGDFYIDYIIMDGGSTDKTVNIIKKYETLLREKKWKVRCQGIEYRWVSEKDNGQADAINKGFDKARGDILNWINADDRLLPGALSSVARSVRDNPDAGLWVGGCHLVNSTGKVLKEIMPFGLSKDKLAAWGDKGYFLSTFWFHFSKSVERLLPP